MIDGSDGNGLSCGTVVADSDFCVVVADDCGREAVPLVGREGLASWLPGFLIRPDPIRVGGPGR